MLLDIIKKGTTDYSCMVRVVDSTDGTPETTVAYNTAGVDLWYRRPGAAHTSITEATQTEAGAHSDGGFVHISDGYCRLDLPDAAVASGVDYVDVGGTFTGMVVIGGRIRLTDVDLDDSVRAGLTSLPSAAADAAGGLPVSDAGGLDLDALNTAAVRLTAARAQVLDDWINGGRLDLILDIIAVDATTDIPALLSTIDTVVDAIKAKTDSLTFTQAGEVDSNVQSVNDVALAGDGSANPMGVA